MTQTAQHTQGPWGADQYADHVSYFSPARKDDYAFRVEFPDDMPEPEAEANAVLIEAAPDLLAALQAIVEMIDPYSLDKEGREAHGKALRAIWKATPRRATNRPGDEAAVMHEETGIDYERCLIMCNMD